MYIKIISTNSYYIIKYSAILKVNLNKSADYSQRITIHYMDENRKEKKISFEMYMNSTVEITNEIEIINSHSSASSIRIMILDNIYNFKQSQNYE